MNSPCAVCAAEADVEYLPLTCRACQGYENGFCAFVAKAPPPAATTQIAQTVTTVPARRIVCRERDLQDSVPIICHGWAASVVALSGGSRQILAFVLPGEMISTALLVATRPHCLIEAITEVRYRLFSRTALQEMMRRDARLMENISRAWFEERVQADQLITDLGVRSATERIARLLLNLADRLKQRGMTQGEAPVMEFPLRQHHIADATGLTPVHVSKVLSEFRRNGLIEISDRSLTILDPARFHRIADMR